MFKRHKKFLGKLSVHIGTTVTFTGFMPFSNVTLIFFGINQPGIFYFGQVTIVNHINFEKLPL